MYDIQLDRYYNRTEDNPQYSDYKSLLFRAGDALQSAEMNEIQTTFKSDVNYLAKRFLRNGEIIQGGNAEITMELTGGQNGSGDDLYDISASFSEAVIFMGGNFVRVDEAVLIESDQVPIDSSYSIGVQIQYTEITNSDDTTLVDPAVETRNYGQAGAGRLQIIGSWMNVEDYQETADTEFLPIFDIIKGEIYNRHKEGVVDNNGFNTFRQDVINIVAKYDRNANGNYLVSGYETEYLERVEIDDGLGGVTTSNLGPFRFSVADGSANVDGYNFEFDISQEIDLEALIDFELKQDEPISFSVDGWYPVRHTPIRKVFRVSGQRTRTDEAIQHGSYIGASDELPNEYQPVRSVASIWNGLGNTGIQYIEGQDWSLVGDSILWLNGAVNEPLPSSTYYVTFNYQYTETETNFSSNGTADMGEISTDLNLIYFHGFADGTDVQFDYDFTLQRIDAIFIDATGNIGNVKGVPDENDPRVPDTDAGMTLKIAEVLLGGNFDPIVTLSSQRVFKMSDVQLLLDNIKQNEYNITRMALEMNLAEKQPGATLKGQFVDNFENDLQRDAGLENAAVTNDGAFLGLTIGGNMIMDIDWENYNLDPATSTLEEQMSIEMPSTPRTISILNQPHYTKNRQINEYLFKSPPGAKIKITPSVYRWVSKTSYKTFVRQVQIATRSINSFTTKYKTFGTHDWHSVQAVETTSQSTSRQVLGSSVSRSESIQQSRVPAIIPQISVKISSNARAYDGNEPIEVTFDGKLAATINADVQGTLNGTFIVPANVISGSKEVIAKGVNTKISGTTLFRAEPLSRSVQTTVTSWWRWVVRRQGVVWREADPVAQSFVLNDSIALDRIRIIFDVLPTTDVSCVVCETSAGFPDKDKAVISKTLAPDELAAVKTAQDFVFDNKVVLTKGKEYAYIIICKDAVGRVQVAELGEKTTDLPSIWLTGQAYSIGTLYNSSNNSAWTPLQKEDMRFWIYGCDFDASFEAPFAEHAVTDATDIMVLANAKVYEGSAIQYKVELIDRVATPTLSNTYLVNSYSQFPLTNAYTGDIRVTAVFASNGLYSPVLDPNIQLSVGNSKKDSIYITRAFPVDYHDETLVAMIDNYNPSNTVIGLQAQIISPIDQSVSWVDLVKDNSSTPLGNEWVETIYSLALQDGSAIMDVTQDVIRVKINMATSNDINRPIIANLRINTSNI